MTSGHERGFVQAQGSAVDPGNRIRVFARGLQSGRECTIVSRRLLRCAAVCVEVEIEE